MDDAVGRDAYSTSFNQVRLYNQQPFEKFAWAGVYLIPLTVCKDADCLRPYRQSYDIRLRLRLSFGRTYQKKLAIAKIKTKVLIVIPPYLSKIGIVTLPAFNHTPSYCYFLPWL